MSASAYFRCLVSAFALFFATALPAQEEAPSVNDGVEELDLANLDIPSFEKLVETQIGLAVSRISGFDFGAFPTGDVATYQEAQQRIESLRKTMQAFDDVYSKEYWRINELVRMYVEENEKRIPALEPRDEMFETDDEFIARLDKFNITYKKPLVDMAPSLYLRNFQALSKAAAKARPPIEREIRRYESLEFPLDIEGDEFKFGQYFLGKGKFIVTLNLTRSELGVDYIARVDMVRESAKTYYSDPDRLRLIVLVSYRGGERSFVRAQLSDRADGSAFPLTRVTPIQEQGPNYVLTALNTVIDRNTGLEWTVDLGDYGVHTGNTTWPELIGDATRFVLGDRLDWRMPTENEVRGLCTEEKEGEKPSVVKDISGPVYIPTVFHAKDSTVSFMEPGHPGDQVMAHRQDQVYGYDFGRCGTMSSIHRGDSIVFVRQY